MNPLDQYPTIRKNLYLLQWLVNLALGVVGIVLTSLGKSPAWFVITSAAFNFVWSYSGITAQTNVVDDDPGDDPRPLAPFHGTN